jgi:hypothetical protein
MCDSAVYCGVHKKGIHVNTLRVKFCVFKVLRCVCVCGIHSYHLVTRFNVIDDIRNDMEKLKIKNWTSCI